jgi:hypothetical protein
MPSAETLNFANLLRKPVFHLRVHSVGLSETQRSALEKIRRTRSQPPLRSSEEAYGQMKRIVAAQIALGVHALANTEMRTFAVIALFLLAGGIRGIAADGGVSQRRYKVASDFKTCPDGHTALRDVPILYGLVGPLYRKPADYTDEDRKLLERVRKGEIVFGGDGLPAADRPPFRIVCRQCSFEYTPFLPLDPNSQWNAWNKGGKKVSDFKIPFSKTLLSFPLVEPVAGSVGYSQSLDSEGRVLKCEGVSYYTVLKINSVLQVVQKWLDQNQRNSKNLKRVLQAYAYHTYAYNDNYVSLHVMDDDFWNPGQVSVSVSFFTEEAGKSKQFRDPCGNPFQMR